MNGYWAPVVGERRGLEDEDDGERIPSSDDENAMRGRDQSASSSSAGSRESSAIPSSHEGEPAPAPTVIENDSGSEAGSDIPMVD